MASLVYKDETASARRGNIVRVARKFTRNKKLKTITAFFCVLFLQFNYSDYLIRCACETTNTVTDASDARRVGGNVDDENEDEEDERSM